MRSMLRRLHGHTDILAHGRKRQEEPDSGHGIVRENLHQPAHEQPDPLDKFVEDVPAEVQAQP